MGGAAIVIVEATAVESRGRITPGDLGIWKDEHREMLGRIARFVKSQGAVPAIQIAHAGRKASCHLPWEGGLPIAPDAPGGWVPVAPSAVPFRDGDPVPAALTVHEIHELTKAFVAATRRALSVGFEAIELHAAHGYLFNEFLSPLANHRNDEYGGVFDNRIRFLLEVATAVRAEMPAGLPLFVRISATDWKEGGWTIEDSIELAIRLKAVGVDLIDCSSGGLVPDAKILTGPGYQVPFAERIRSEAHIATAAVGSITEPEQAEAIVSNGRADLVLLARAFLRDPYWPAHAAKALGTKIEPPPQYMRAW